MSLTVFKDLEQRSPEWFAARCGIATASVVGKLITPTLQVADNDTSRGITANLVAERITGDVEETYMSADMFRGVVHEPIARDAYSKHFEQATECGFMRLDVGNWSLGYSPDGLVGDDGLLEVKCPRAKAHVLTILADEVPPYYMAQLQAGLFVSGRKWIDYVSFCAGLPLYVKRVLPDERWHDAITDACITFETNAAEMVARYVEKAKNMPATERVPDFDLEVI